MPDNEVDSARFDVPASPQKNIYEMKNFLGCDFTSSPSAVDVNHSPNCVNMIRYMPGKVRKRMGYSEIVMVPHNRFSPSTIRHIWKWDDDTYIVDGGASWYKFNDEPEPYINGRGFYYIGRMPNGQFDWSPLKTGVNTAYSGGIKYYRSDGQSYDYPTCASFYYDVQFYKLGDVALIIDESNQYQNDDEQLHLLAYRNDTHLIYSVGYVRDYWTAYSTELPTLYCPTVILGCKPDGTGGTQYEAFNMLNQAATVSYYVGSQDASSTRFACPFSCSGVYAAKYVKKVEVLTASGAWEERFNGSGGSDWANGAYGYSIEFNTAPGVSPIQGEDNVRITWRRNNTQHLNNIGKICKCSFGITYGVNGNHDRLFLSGNSQYPNYDWHSDKDNITYFPDTSYSVLGADDSPIKGYLISGNYLVTLKAPGAEKQVAVIRNGTLDSNGNAVFITVKGLQGFPMVSYNTAIMAGIEPLFLSTGGVMAITSTDIAGDQIMSSRSFYVNGKLMKEPNLDKAFAVQWKDYYVLFVNNHVYLLDTLQITTTNNTPYSNRQYACFYWELPHTPTCAVVIDDVIYFGTEDRYTPEGWSYDTICQKLMKFKVDENALASYSDNGEAIRCVYETASIDSITFFKMKTYRYFALRVFPAVRSSVKIWAFRDSLWDLLKEDHSTAKYFKFTTLTFSKISFRTDKETRLINSKIRIKKQDHVRFKIENDELNEPLMIDQFGIEYTQGKNYKY